MREPPSSATDGSRRPSRSDVVRAGRVEDSELDRESSRTDHRSASESLDDILARLLESNAEERDAALALVERDDPELARRIRSRLVALGELGLSLDQPRRAIDLPTHFGEFR